MKKVKVKRLVYTSPIFPPIIGGVEFDGTLSDSNILGMIHERGKTEWFYNEWTGQNELWFMKNENQYLYHITVGTFYLYKKSWYDDILKCLIHG